MNLETIFGSNKLLKHLDRVDAWQRGEVPPPVTVEFDLTGRCNHRCPECAGLYHHSEMQSDTAREWLTQLESYGVRGLIFTGGGEPLMHPDCLPLVEYAKGLGMQVGFITNGSLLREEHAERLTLACTWIRVSIDAADADTYQQIHGVGNSEFVRAWQSVGFLSEARDKHQSSCTVGVGYLYGEQTFRGTPVAIVKARNLGADYLQIRPFHNDGFPLTILALGSYKSEERGRFHVISSTHKYQCQGGKRTYATCHGAWFTSVIQADGSVQLCCHLRGNPAWSLGSMNQQSFKEIWSSPRHAELLQRLEVEQCIPLCRNDGINRDLEAILKPICHEDFL